MFVPSIKIKRKTKFKVTAKQKQLKSDLKTVKQLKIRKHENN